MHLSAELWAGLTPRQAALPHLLGEALICASTALQLSSHPGRGPFEVRFCFNYLCLRNGFQISLVLEVTWLHPNCLLNPLGYSCLENPMDRGAWQAVVHRVTKSQTRLKWLNNTAFSSQGKNSFFFFFPGLMLVSPHWSDPKGKKLSHSHTHSHLCSWIPFRSHVAISGAFHISGAVWSLAGKALGQPSSPYQALSPTNNSFY